MFNIIGYGTGILLMLLALFMYIKQMKKLDFIEFSVIICMVAVILIAGSEII